MLWGLLVVVYGSTGAWAVGYGGEVHSQEWKTAYLNTEVSLYLGPIYYRELFNARNKGSEDFQDRVLEMISKSFEEADLDKNGTVTRNELSLRLGSNKALLASKEQLETFHGMDRDGDNSLTWREFLVGSFSPEFVDLFDRGYVDVEALAVEGGRAEYEAFHAYHKYHRFKLADFDRSDSLSAEEYLRFVNPALYPELRESYYKEVVQDVQSDDDNEHVSLAEFKANIEMKALLTRPDDPGRYMDTQLQRFRDLDLDKDGRLNQNETREWFFGEINTNNTHLVKEQVDQHFRICDENKDNLLQFEEMLEQPDFLFEGIDPHANRDLAEQLKKLLSDQGKDDITDFFTDDAIDDLAKKEAERRSILGNLADQYDLAEDEDFGSNNIFQDSFSTGLYDYDPEWDPDNKIYRHGFIPQTESKVVSGYSTEEWAKQMIERNGFDQVELSSGEEPAIKGDHGARIEL